MITKRLEVRVSKKNRRMTIPLIPPKKSLRTHMTYPKKPLLNQLGPRFKGILNHRYPSFYRELRNIKSDNILKIIVGKNTRPKLMLTSTPVYTNANIMW